MSVIGNETRYWHAIRRAIPDRQSQRDRSESIERDLHCRVADATSVDSIDEVKFQIQPDSEHADIFAFSNRSNRVKGKP